MGKGDQGTAKHRADYPVAGKSRFHGFGILLQYRDETSIERREQGEVEVIPIILRHVYWQGEPLGKLQALPADGVPVTDSHWHTLDVAFSSVTLEIKKVAEMLLLVQSLREALSFFDADQFTEALESYDKALHLNPTSAEALWGKGETFRELGRYIEALEAYEQAVNFRGKALCMNG